MTRDRTILYGGIILFILLPLGWVTHLKRAHTDKVRAWTPVVGTVISRELQSPGLSRTSEIIRYRYEIAGVRYEGSYTRRPRYGSVNHGGINVYGPNDPIELLVNPARPAESVMARR
jgi:hypothetical protein